MSESKRFSLFFSAQPNRQVAVLSLTAATITNAEQNIVALDEKDVVVAVVELQPGVDRKQI